uniref:IKI3-like protein n=1 Tax=Tanacetum cinerariifolium TaxID=118510 RepID=A0A6L2KZA7_TANCI|nr:IKI3-like protein [Tanacetum cinerariifolium]
MCSRGPEMLRVKSLPNHPLISYNLQTLQKTTENDMRNSNNLVTTRNELLRTISEKEEPIRVIEQCKSSNHVSGFLFRIGFKFRIPDEEMALVDHLKGMSLASGAARELKSLLACLVMIGKEDIARKLQRVGENFQLSQKAAVKLAEDAMACDIVDEHVFVLELYIKKLRNELLQSEEFSWQSKVFVTP